MEVIPAPVLISIRKPHTDHIFDGTKTVELRKSVPKYIPEGSTPVKYPFRAYVYECKDRGGAGAIVGFFDCPGYIGARGTYMESMARDAQVTMEQLEKYGGGGWVYAWKVVNANRFSQPITLAELGIERPPQSWQYLSDTAVIILRLTAADRRTQL